MPAAALGAWHPESAARTGNCHASYIRHDIYRTAPGHWSAQAGKSARNDNLRSHSLRWWAGDSWSYRRQYLSCRFSAQLSS